MSATAPSLHASGPLVDAAWLAERLGQTGLVVLDSTTNIQADANGHERIVPDREAFAAAHIPGARFVDLQGELSAPDAPFAFTLPDTRDLQQGLRALGVRQHDTLVVYSTGNPWWATRVWWTLQAHGLSRVHVLDGGLRHWAAAGLPLESGPARPWPAGDIVVPHADAFARTIDAAALQARLGDADLRLVNALPPDKFAGRTPVHGGRAGHIPGSLNLPAASLIDPATGLLRPAPEREALLRAQGLLDAGKEVVAYCGGGVSATLVLFALALAGRHDARLYDASLAEWAKRADLPIATLP